MIYILRNTFIPNTASSNRALAYYRAMDKMGIDATIVLLQTYPSNQILNENFNHLKIQFFIKSGYCGNKTIRRFQYILRARRFLSCLKKGDKVYIYGENPLIHTLVNKRGIDVFVEITEHPLIYPVRTRFINNSHKKSIEDLKKIKGLFVISDYLKSFFLSQGIDPKCINIINMMVDAQRFNGLKKRPEKRYVCYCGNCNNKKDKVDDLIRAFGLVSQQMPDVFLYIVGPKEQVYSDEQNNVKLAESLGLKEKVLFTGVLPADKIPQILVNAELLLLYRPDTLQNRAGFPTKLGEYLLSGTPVVATKIGDIPLFLKHRENAYLISTGNIELFASELMFALNNHELSTMIGENGKKLALNCFNAETETKKLISIITENR